MTKVKQSTTVSIPPSTAAGAVAASSRHVFPKSLLALPLMDVTGRGFKLKLPKGVSAVAYVCPPVPGLAAETPSPSDPLSIPDSDLNVIGVFYNDKSDARLSDNIIYIVSLTADQQSKLGLDAPYVYVANTYSKDAQKLYFNDPPQLDAVVAGLGTGASGAPVTISDVPQATPQQVDAAQLSGLNVQAAPPLATPSPPTPSPAQHVFPMVELAPVLDVSAQNIALHFSESTPVVAYIQPPLPGSVEGKRLSLNLAALLKVAKVTGVIYNDASADRHAENVIYVVALSAEQQAVLHIDASYIYVSNVLGAGATQSTFYTLDELDRKLAGKPGPALAESIARGRAKVSKIAALQDAVAATILGKDADQNYWSEAASTDLVPISDAGLDLQAVSDAALVTTSVPTQTYTGDPNRALNDYGSVAGLEAETTENFRTYVSGGGSIAPTWSGTDISKTYQFIGDFQHFDPWTLYTGQATSANTAAGVVDSETGAVAFKHDAWRVPTKGEATRIRGNYSDHLFSASLTPPQIGKTTLQLATRLYLGSRSYDESTDLLDPFHQVFASQTQAMLILQPLANNHIYISPYAQYSITSLYQRADIGAVSDFVLGRRDFMALSIKGTGPLWGVQPTYYEFLKGTASFDESGTISETYPDGHLDSTIDAHNSADISATNTYAPVGTEQLIDLNFDLRELHYFSNDAYLGVQASFDPQPFGYYGTSNHFVASLSSGGRVGKQFSINGGLGISGFAGSDELFGTASLQAAASIKPEFQPSLKLAYAHSLLPGLSDEGFDVSLTNSFTHDFGPKSVLSAVKADLYVDVASSGMDQVLGMATGELDRRSVKVGLNLTYTPKFKSADLAVKDAEFTAGTASGPDVAGAHQGEVTTISNWSGKGTFVFEPAKRQYAWKLKVDASGKYTWNGLGRAGAYNLYFSDTPLGLQDVVSESQGIEAPADAVEK